MPPWWTDSARGKYDRAAKRYATDLTNSEFLLIEPWLPPPVRPRPTTQNGSPSGARRHLLSVADRLPVAAAAQMLPTWSTVFGYFRRWRRRQHLLGLYVRAAVPARASAGREAQPTAGIVDSQIGQDQRKRRPARPRCRLRRSTAASATSWSTRWACCCAAVVHPASVQDRDGLAALLTRIRRRFPFLARSSPTGGYQGEVALPPRPATSGSS